MPSVLRIIDANGNRAREALRVMEEAARFVLDDPALVADVKAIRHGLREALRGVASDAVLWRDTPGDVGTGVKGSGEATREGVADVAIAAGKRLSEALRSIEEYGKTLPEAATLTPRVEALRYRGYEAERRLTAALAGMRGRQWSLCVLISERLCPGGDWEAVVGASIEGGADCVQLREKDLEAGELLRRARRVVEVCRPRRVSVIVNDRPDVALLAGADGVHLGQTDLPCAEVRKLVGRQLLIGVSTSQLAEAERALADGADYCGVGPMFPTSTKKKDVIVGPAYLREFLAWGRLPHLAIGGITAGNVGDVVAAGVRGVAVSSCVCGAADPTAACRAILEGLQRRP